MRGATDDVSPASRYPTNYAPYASSIASSATTSVASLWSDALSQSSDDTSASAHSSDSESCDPLTHLKQTWPAESCLRNRPVQQHRHLPPLVTQALPAELRQNPRRSAPSSQPRAGGTPSLVRQSDRKVNFVDNLVDSSTQIVEAIWPLSSVVCRSELGSKAVLPLRTFIQETLRRSRTSFSTLQVALYYLILIKPHVPKHNFTTEQPGDRLADRALQCGRRMFLAALILASKYLQDRNYSARAWSKISGLNTLEINQNEIAFLLAVNWKLHITDEVFRRWTEIVLKRAPPPAPPSPGGLTSANQQTVNWKNFILSLDPDLANIEGLVQTSQLSVPKLSDLSALSPRSILNAPQERLRGISCETTGVSPRSSIYAAATPTILEPTPTTLQTPGRLAPALGRLPTPRLTPQSAGLCTPAASAASQMLASNAGAMCMAMAQASTAAASQYLDRLPTSAGSSPLGYCPVRRSSLAMSVSTASSPESMMSDTSRASRSSSISSASSLASATLNVKLGLPSRFRASKLCMDRAGGKLSVPSVPETYDEHCFTSSPEPYGITPARYGDAHVETPRESQAVKAGSKRTRSQALEDPLQDNVRDILSETYNLAETSWPGASDSRKRLCCSAEAANGFQTVNQLSRAAFRGPGMWDGILN
jgi:hypothetical protein